MEKARCMKEKMMGKFEEYEVKRAADTIVEAEEIKNNEELMEQVKKIIKVKVKSLKDLKRIANTKSDEDDSEESED